MRPLTCNGSINGSIYDLMVSLRADGWGGAQLEESRAGAGGTSPVALSLVFWLLRGEHLPSAKHFPFLVFSLTSDPKPQVRMSMGGLSNMS